MLLSSLYSDCLVELKMTSCARCTMSIPPVLNERLVPLILIIAAFLLLTETSLLRWGLVRIYVLGRVNNAMRETVTRIFCLSCLALTLTLHFRTTAQPTGENESEGKGREREEESGSSRRGNSDVCRRR